MCRRSHYVEYLVGVVAKANIDPLPILDLTDCVQELRRRGIPLPERGPWDTDPIYREMCQKVREKQTFFCSFSTQSHHILFDVRFTLCFFPFSKNENRICHEHTTIYSNLILQTTHVAFAFEYVSSCLRISNWFDCFFVSDCQGKGSAELVQRKQQISDLLLSEIIIYLIFFLI